MVGVCFCAVRLRLWTSDNERVREVGPKSGDCEFRREIDARVGDPVSGRHDLSRNEGQHGYAELYANVSFVLRGPGEYYHRVTVSNTID